MGFLEDWWNGKKTINPVALAWNALPPEAKASYSSIPGLLAEMSPGASVRDAVEAGGEIGHGILNADPKAVGLGAANMGVAALGLLPGARAGKVAEKAVKEASGIRAYHGSPHSFEQFDASKIGTGEGAQAYGHGLYFAENEAVAKGYRDALSGKASPLTYQAYKDGVAVPWHELTPDQTKLLPILQEAGGDLNKAKEIVKAEYRSAAHDRLIKGLDDLVKGGYEARAPGHMYEVDIKANPDHFLDLDKPVNRQGLRVQRAIADMQGVRIPELGSETGMQFLKSGDYGDPAGVSQILKEYGVPGAKYFDGSSRSAGEGTRNYVVFDPATIEILRKYGLLPAAGGAALAPGLLGPAEEY